RHSPPAHAYPEYAPSPPFRYPPPRKYSDPLGLPPGTTPLRLHLIDVASLPLEPPGRASPVPHRAVDTCRSPYPGGIQRCSDVSALSVAFAVACPARLPLPFG